MYPFFCKCSCSGHVHCIRLVGISPHETEMGPKNLGPKNLTEGIRSVVFRYCHYVVYTLPFLANTTGVGSWQQVSENSGNELFSISG